MRSTVASLCFALLGALHGGCGAPTGEAAAPAHATAEHAPTTHGTSAPVALASSPAVAPEPSASVSAAPPPDLGCEPAQGVDVPALFRPLFEKGRRVRYSAGDDVDPHDPSGGRIVTKTKIVCVVRSLRRFRDAVGSELACAPEVTDEYLVGPEAVVFLLNDRGIWMAEGRLSDQAAASKAMEDPLLLPAKPASGRRSWDEPTVLEYRNKCTAVVEVKGPNVCTDTRCNVPWGGYGDTVDRRCFSAARGLESWRRVNLAGPRTTTWQLLDVKAPSAPPAPADGAPVVPPCVEPAAPK